MLFNNCVEKETEAVWRDAARSLEFERITSLSEDEIAFLSVSETEIAKRQEVFRDVLSSPDSVTGFEEFLNTVKDVEDIRKRALVYPPKSTDSALYTLSSFSMIFSAVDKLKELGAGFGGRFKSERLLAMFGEARRLSDSEEFKEDRKYVSDISEGIEKIRSMTLCVNLDAKLEPYEIGVLECHPKPFMSSNALTGLLGSDRSTMIRHISPLMPQKANAEMREAVYSHINSSISKSLRKKASEFLPKINRYADMLSALRTELEFLLKSVKTVNEFKARTGRIAYPEVSDSFEIVDLYSQKLCANGKEVIIPNTVKKKDGVNLYLLTGANNGGKSIFVNMVGISQILFQLGLPVCAASAKMKLFRRLYCHFTSTLNDRESRFVDECRRMKTVIDGIGEDSLVLMDESFSSTGYEEGTEVAYKVLERVKKKGTVCFFSTHLHSLRDCIKDGGLVIEPMRIIMDGDSPTYRVEYGAYDDYSHAMRIANEYKLFN
ncbi:MAG: hypothetical protein IJS94_00685 [Clostridia bacterium]|nr:hypothetical protein [Clostridia bacterium]